MKTIDRGASTSTKSKKGIEIDTKSFYYRTLLNAFSIRKPISIALTDMCDCHSLYIVDIMMAESHAKPS